MQLFSKTKARWGHITAYRDVSLGDPDAKLYGQILRKFVLRMLGDLDPQMQFGSGLGGGGCDLPHLAASAALGLGEATSQCAALLFIDVSTAFASMVRETVIPTEAGCEAWMHFLIDRGFPREFAAEVIQSVSAMCNLEGDCLSQHAAAVLRDFHQCTWFSMELLEGTTTTLRGCTAGNPIADLIYISCDTLLARRLHATLSEQGLEVQVPGQGVFEFFGLSGNTDRYALHRIGYVDDAVIPILAPASEIVHRLCRTASIAKFMYECYGLSVNFSKGKTEAIMSFHGAGAQAVRHRVFVECCSSLPCEGVAGVTFDL